MTIRIEGMSPAEIRTLETIQSQHRDRALVSINGHLLATGEVSAVRFIEGGLAIDLLPPELSSLARLANNE